MSSDTSNEDEIRKKLIENDLVDCMVALPAQLFYNTGIPACLWCLSRNKFHQEVDKQLLQDPEFAPLHKEFETKIILAVQLIEAAMERQFPLKIVSMNSW